MRALVKGRFDASRPRSSNGNGSGDLFSEKPSVNNAPKDSGMAYTVALAGNPNCGKTTLFNALTGSNQYVGNWPGVTVERREARFGIDPPRYGAQNVPLRGAHGKSDGGDALETDAACADDVTLVDLPGVYSLSPYSIEERIAGEYLGGGEPDVIVTVADATRLKRNLYLACQILDIGKPVVLALNMMDELRDRGGRIGCEALSKALGARVVPVSAKREEGFDRLFAAIYEAARENRYESAEPSAAASCGAGVSSKPGSGKADPSSDAVSDADIYARTEAALALAGYDPGAEKGYSPDRILLGKAAYPAFFLFLGATFALTFGPVGGALSKAAAQCLDAFARVPLSGLLSAARSPEWVRSLALDGVIGGVGGVISFLPQILLLFLCLAVMEDCGYMARAAFLTDRPLRLLGLSGRSFIPMLLGFGCTTTAVMGARTVENERDRRMTVLLTPLMSCGAKIPVYSLVAAAVFPRSGALLILGLYALGMALLFPVGLLLRRFAFREGETPFVMELPPYRMPTARGVLYRLRDRAKEFLLRAGTLIFAMSVLVWFLQSFTPDLRFTRDGSLSLFGALGGALAPFFAPLGFGDWKSGVSLLSGLVAKEALVSTMQVVNRAPDAAALSALIALQWSRARALSFLTFVLLYPPCVSAMAAMRRELGSLRHIALSIGLQTALAWVAAFCAYRIALWIW